MESPEKLFVVGVGTSAGGLDAVRKFLDNIPDNTGLAFVIVQHFSAGMECLTPGLLSNHTRMEVRTVDQEQEIGPNCVYLNPGNKNLGIRGNQLIFLETSPKDPSDLPVDSFFHMLGESYRTRAIGVVLSGMGSDGARGIRTIKESGGTVLVQLPESAQFKDMPNAAIQTSLGDFILPPEKIAEKIVLHAREWQTKAELKEAEQRLNTALEAGNMAWWEMELPSGRVLFSSNKTDMLGRDARDFSHYRDFTNLVHPDDYEPAMEAMRNHLSGKSERYECQYRILNARGTYQWFQDVGQVVFRDEQRTLVAGIVIEVTHKKLMEIQLMEAMQKAETANTYKSQFLANMSHEIRTPMNSLVGFASLLREGGQDDETRNRYIEIIESSSKQLLTLINDIIDVSKIEAGELKVDKQPCHLKELLSELEIMFHELKLQKDKSQLEILSEVPEAQQHLRIYTDAGRLKQVFINLIGNALKFTDSGSIRFGFTVRDKKVIFFVADTGMGMPKDKLQLIFERFQQLEQANRTKSVGTGLGLAISKGIVELLGGTISVDSQEGKGSVFTFDLPLEPVSVAPPASGPPLPPELGAMQGKRILIAEDDPMNRLYLQEALKNLSLELLWASNGAEAVDLFVHEPRVDLVLMDIRMPVKDGFSAAREMLAHDPGAVLIAQTAQAMASDREKCLNQGFADYIAKPLRKDQLLRLIARWLAASR